MGLIDCDGYRISAKKTFHARELRPDFAAPELQRSGSNVRPDMGDEYQDRFAIALIVFSLLNDGLTFQRQGESRANHPKRYSVAHPRVALRIRATAQPLVVPGSSSSIHERFPDALRDLFDRAVLKVGPDRPSAKEWADGLHQLLASASRCKKVAVHGNSVLSGKCMLCAKQEAFAALSQPQGHPTKQVSYTRAAPSPVAAPVSGPTPIRL